MNISTIEMDGCQVSLMESDPNTKTSDVEVKGPHEVNIAAAKSLIKAFASGQVPDQVAQHRRRSVSTSLLPPRSPRDLDTARRLNIKLTLYYITSHLAPARRSNRRSSRALCQTRASYRSSPDFLAAPSALSPLKNQVRVADGGFIVRHFLPSGYPNFSLFAGTMIRRIDPIFIPAIASRTRPPITRYVLDVRLESKKILLLPVNAPPFDLFLASNGRP